MTAITASISIALDGFAAGPNQSLEHPLGEGGMRLHQWVFPTRAFNEMHGREGGEDGPDSDVLARAAADVGAYVMGRKIFGGGSGPWDTSWIGWWGEEPPFHAPVFVLTHHEREPLQLAGGTTFTFVTAGLDAALEQAQAAAGGREVKIAGGASTIRQTLAAGRLDELQLHVVPVLLGAGERLLDGAGDPLLEPVEVVASPGVTHIRYRVGAAAG
ncbi:MAG TPA: dihydrofolate reductase family protein [Baekduia sp.]|nr:dihydrofolate reductase family protein [Baekduia sp.]